MELVLTEKIPQGRDRKFLSELEASLRGISSGLGVDIKVKGLTKSRLPRLQISGEDEEAFTEILRRSFGLAPRDHVELLDKPIRRGFVQRPPDQDDALLMDVGLESSSPFQVTLGADRLRAQLLDGRDVSLRGMVARYGFFEDFPLELRIISCDEDNRRLHAELSDRQWNMLKEWSQLPLDRITAQDVLDSEVRSAVKRASLERDFAAVENLSLGTHSLICKLGTDGKGLVPKLGPHLKAARLFVFHPNSCEHGEPLKSKLSDSYSQRLERRSRRS